MTTKQRCVLFDLDGTLLDTASDLIAALNHVLEKHQHPQLSFAEARPYAGHGCKGLLKIGMNIENDDPRYSTLARELLDFYQTHLLDSTRFFSGMEKVLAHLDQAEIPWGIVTNKPKRFTLPLAEQLGLLQRARCIISGDTLEKRKPHPEPILHACELIQADPAESFYVGDTEGDIIASKAAGIKSLLALYGYIRAEEKPLTWEATAYIHSPEEIISHL